MKKQDKIALLRQGMEKTVICRCRFRYETDAVDCYPNAVNDTFLVGQTEDEFLLDGYCIRKLSQLENVELGEDSGSEINKRFGITEQISDPGVDLSSWQTIFASLSQLDAYIQIEDAANGQFAIGVIEKVMKNRLYFKPFDADGVWAAESLEIRYGQITSVQWDTRYARYWKRFLEMK